ncbi:right-handed parallel beta-helix repeat-containing protein [soil metagenome]
MSFESNTDISQSGARQEERIEGRTLYVNIPGHDPFSVERFGGNVRDNRALSSDMHLPQYTLEDKDSRLPGPGLDRVGGAPTGQAVDTSRSQFFVSPNGNDHNSGSADQPWQTIQKGAKSATPGSVVNVMPGEYRGQVNVTVSGNERDGFVTFRSTVPGGAVLNLSGERGGGNETAGFKIQNRNYIEVSGFEIKNLKGTNSDSTPNGVLISGGSSHIRLTGLDIHHIENNINRKSNAHGISVYGDGKDAASASRDIVIANNKLHDLKLGASEAIVINGNVENFTIANNRLTRLNNIGIDVAGFEGTSRGALDQPRQGIISGNYLSDIDSRGNPAYGGARAAGGIYVDGGTRVTISGNTVERANIGIELASEHKGRTTSSVTVSGNLLKHNTMSGISLGGAERTNGGATGNLIENNRLIENDTDRTGSGEIAFQNFVTNTTIRGNKLVSGGVFISNEARIADSNKIYDNQMSGPS